MDKDHASRYEIFYKFFTCFLMLVGGLDSQQTFGFSTNKMDVINYTSTFENIGLYWTPVNGSKENICSVKFRLLGSETWREGLPLWFDERDGEYRGSIVELQQGTQYEVQLSLKSGTIETVIAKTWSDDFPIAKTIYLDESSNQTYKVEESGTAEGYVLYTNRPGKTATIDVLKKQPLNMEVTDGVHHVIIRGITMKGSSSDGLRIRDNCSDIVIEHCNISDWGSKDSSTGYGVNRQAAILNHGDQNSTRIVVQRNTIHNPTYGSNSWEHGHPGGPQAISFYETAGNHVIRYNDIFSSWGKYYNDALGAGRNDSWTGFPSRDSDIYGNKISHCFDDAIEAEGGNNNVRIYGNLMDDTFVKIGIAGTSRGPLYIWRNVGLKSRRIEGQTDSDQYKRGPFLKSGGDDPHFKGKTYVFHNSVLQPEAAGKSEDLGSLGSVYDSGGELYELQSRNNVFTTSSYKGKVIKIGATTCSNSFDHDLYYGRVEINCEEDFEPNGILLTDGEKPNWSATNGNEEFYLASEAKGVDQGTRLPNFNDGFVGQAPDIGAFEVGAPPLEFGVDAYSNQTTTNRAPYFTSTPILKAKPDQLFSYRFEAIDPDNNSLRFKVSKLPTWLTLVPEEQAIKGTPSIQNIDDDNEVRISVTDGIIETPVEQSFKITINQDGNGQPVFTFDLVTSVKAGKNYYQEVSATDPDNEKLIFIAAELPVWLTYDLSSNVLSGKPGCDFLGKHNLVLKVTDGKDTTTMEKVLEVIPNDPPQINTNATYRASINEKFELTIPISDPENEAINLSVNQVPSWLTYNTGTLIGTPLKSDVGNYDLTVTAEDLCKNVVSRKLTVQAKEFNSNEAPYFTTNSKLSISKAGKFSVKISAIDPDGDNLEFVAVNLPEWLQFDSQSQIITGNANFENNGTYKFAITVTDSFIEQEIKQDFELEVKVVDSQDDATEAETTGEVWRKVLSSSDDAEEVLGQVSLFSSDLEMVEEKNRQTIGIRFTDITVPKNAEIIEARIVFVSDETHLGTTSLQVFGEAKPDPSTFTKTSSNISHRSLSKSFANWNPEGWNQRNSEYSSPSLITIVSELVHQVGWENGNSMAFIIKGLGKRVAQTYDKNPDAAPQLYIKYKSVTAPEVLQLDKAFSFKSYPNPFSDYIKMEFELDSKEEVEVSIVDMNGRSIEHLLQTKELDAGLHNYHWETGPRFKSLQKAGIYILKIRIGKRLEFRKMIFSSH